MDDVILNMKKIKKSFPGVEALKEVDLTLYRGEVHGLIGENGAGKSTLMKILGGEYTPDKGKILLNGKEIKIKNPSDAKRHGISFIHQELSIFKDLDIATNIFIQKLPKNSLGLIKFKELYKKTKEILNAVNLPHIKPNRAMSSLKIGEQQLVEIGKCLAQNTIILVLDEPTSSLTSSETNTLFNLIKKLKKENVSIIFISHRMDEVYEICDRITVLRDGERIKTGITETFNKNEIVKLMIGRDIIEMFEGKKNEIGKEIIKVENLSNKNKFENISFTISEGEIVGLFGLMGSGRSEIIRAIFGLDKLQSGSIYIGGKKVRIKKPTQAIKLGIGFITENRREEGLIINHCVQNNLTITDLKAVSGAAGIINKVRETNICKKNIRDFQIKTPSLKQLVKYLSGGNQQKIVIAKWINTKPKLLILDEPTRGIDVGAKSEIYTILSKLAEYKTGALVISSELNEVMGICDRILIIRNGRIVKELKSNEATKESLLALSMGVC